MTITAQSNDGYALGREVGDAVERVVGLGLAESSDRQKNLLRYLVTEELEGRGDRLKAYSIATEVFDRPPDFDPQQDSIVRVEVGRLRKALELYYATNGRSDPVWISIGKGQYRPTFTLRDIVEERDGAHDGRSDRRLIAALTVAAIVFGAWLWLLAGPGSAPARPGPRVAVAPFAFSADREGQAYVGTGLRAEMTSLLSEFDWLAVFPLAHDVDLTTGDRPKNWRVDFLVKANVQVAGGNMVVSPVLLDGATGAVRWTSRYEAPFRAAEVLAMQRQIATKIAADVGQPFGAVANLELTRAALDTFDGDESYLCHLRALQFWTSYRRDDFDRALDCAARLGGSASSKPNLRGLFALLKLDAARFAFDTRPRDGIVAEASDIAADAHLRDDKGSIPRMARYSTALCAGDVDTFRRIALAVVRDYPNNPAGLLDVGGKLALGAGDWEEGLELVLKARELSSNIPNWYDIAGVVDAMRRAAPIALDDLHAAALETSHPLLLLVDVAAQTRAARRPPALAALGRLASLGYDGRDALGALLAGQCWSAEVKTILQPLIAAATQGD